LSRKKKLTFNSLLGSVEVRTQSAKDRQTGEWITPIKDALGIDKYQHLTRDLKNRIAFAATKTNSFEAAAKLINCLARVKVDDSQIQRLVQLEGKKALAEEDARVAAVFDPEGQKKAAEPLPIQQSPDKPFKIMALMVDGLMLRNRGVDWGLKPSTREGERAIWHELKAGLVIRFPEKPLEAPGKKSQDKRPRELDKFYISSAKGPEDAVRRLYAEAKHRGLDQAELVVVIADGALWIWQAAEEYFPNARKLLDYYHVSHHLHLLASDLFPENPEYAMEWAGKLLAEVKKHGGKTLMGLLEILVEKVKTDQLEKDTAVLDREVAYIGKHEDHLDYAEARRLGYPQGSGSMESACKQIQGRFKCPGQFWSSPGETYFLALNMAFRNGYRAIPAMDTDIPAA
jgi:hypothetical protein